MNQMQYAAFVDDEKRALTLSAELINVRIAQIDRFDADYDFAVIIKQAQKAGLEKDELLKELSCSWSTVTRWASGQVKPASFTRRAIKQKLIDMLKHKRSTNLDEASQLEAA